MNHHNHQDSAVVRWKVVGKGASTIEACARHNLRDDHKPFASIDPRLTATNQILFGGHTANAVENSYREKLAPFGKLRVNASTAFEVVFSLPFKTKTTKAVFFADCLAWIISTFDERNLLSFVIHNDEAQPHAHALLVGIKDGVVSANKLLGGISNTYRLLEDFFSTVGAKHGISPPQRLSKQQLEQLAVAVIDNYQERADCALTSETWPIIQVAIKAYPMIFAVPLGIPLTGRMVTAKPKVKTLADFAVSTGKKTNEDRSSKQNPIRGLTNAPTNGVKTKPLPCDRASEIKPIRGFKLDEQAGDSSYVEMTVVMDDDPNQVFDPVTGEHVFLPPKQSRVRGLVQPEVNRLLDRAQRQKTAANDIGARRLAGGQD
jgi:Plasmid recombination enzyme